MYSTIQVNVTDMTKEVTWSFPCRFFKAMFCKIDTRTVPSIVIGKWTPNNLQLLNYIIPQLYRMYLSSKSKETPVTNCVKCHMYFQWQMYICINVDLFSFLGRDGPI